MNFLRSFFASVLGTLTAIGLFFAMIFLIISAVASVLNSSEMGSSINSTSVLDLNLNLPVVERAPAFDEVQKILGLEEQVIGLPQLIKAIQQAAEHPSIAGIRLRSDFVSAGWTQTHSIRNALKKFKSKGKFIYAYGDVFTQKGYFLASVADSVFLNPAGVFEFKGLASEVLYYKDFQEKYGLKMEVVRHGKYKSAVEPFLQNEMSEDNKTQISTLLNDLWVTLRDEIADERNLTPETLDALATSNAISIPQDAVNTSLIDGLLYEDEVDQLIKDRLEISKEDSFDKITVSRMNSSSPSYDSGIKDRIAVVFANGPILYGEGTETVIAQGVFIETLEKLAKDDWIKAIVLRVNSPGGSSLTSELLWRTLENVKKTKPLIVSMGDVAASGGYYIATGAEYLFADPMSITGSIGVFATLPNGKDFIESIGIHARSVETHPNALGYSPFQKMSKAFESQIQKGIEHTYGQFKERVAVGRSLGPEEVESLAQGRVWSGKKALELGLVDRLGDLQDAIAYAAERAGIEAYNVLPYPQFEENLENLLKGISPVLKGNTPLETLAAPLEPLFLKLENSPPHSIPNYIQTLLPYELRIH
jgi:protease-4